ncbi:MAG: NAD(P)/FAD-dependent oxidoreductase [Candidatus Altimarinota bacterium]
MTKPSKQRKSKTNTFKTKPKKSQRIVILGAGYSGIRTALYLSKHLGRDDFEIVLIDRSPKHVYLAELYEIASAYYQEPRNDRCSNELAQTLSIGLVHRFKNQPVKLLIDQLISIDAEKKQLKLENTGSLDFEYLVVSLGSVTNFYNIPGLENAKPSEHPQVYELKTLNQSLQLNCDLENFFQEPKNQNREINIVIGGGGFTGAELAAELVGFIRKLAKKYHFNSSLVHLKVIQSSPQMINLGEKISDLTIKRFNKLGIQSYLNSKILSYQNHHLQIENTQNQQKFDLATDFLIWTAGIKPNPLLKKSFSKLTPAGELETQSTLETLHYPNIFAGGDNASIIDPKTSKPLPKLGQLAIQHGVLIAKNIIKKINRQTLENYRPAFKGFIISLGGRYGLYCKGKLAFGGIIPWMFKKAFDLYYYLTILPLRIALQKWWKNFIIFSHND